MNDDVRLAAPDEQPPDEPGYPVSQEPIPDIDAENGDGNESSSA